MKKLFHSGRSMIEMLGVLAIIGVLSIGGLQAYQLAMDRIRMNHLKSWLAGMEFAILENCYFGDNDNCENSGTGEGYRRNRNLLCSTMGEEYCSSKNTIYIPLEFIPNLEWLVRINEDDTWSVTFRQLTKHQCDLFFQMDLPKNVYRINTNNTSTTFTNRLPVLTEIERNRGVASCKNGAENDALGGIFTMSFSME